MTVGDRIRKLREDRDMTQVELADKIDASKQTVYKYENNVVTNIPSDTIEKIAKVFNVSEAYLMGWEIEPKFSKDRAILEVQITEDAELMKRLKKYMGLPQEKKDLILAMIDNL